MRGYTTVHLLSRTLSCAIESYNGTKCDIYGNLTTPGGNVSVGCAGVGKGNVWDRWCAIVMEKLR